MAGIPASAQTRAELNEAHIIHRQAYHHHIAKDYDAALEGYKKSAAMGLAKSEYGIASILAFDRPNKRELDTALPWFIRALKPREVHQGQGFAQARTYSQNALDWYCKNGGAEFPAGHPYAAEPKCWVGRAKALHYGWFGLRKDRPAAIELLEKAVSAGHSEAQVTLDKFSAKAKKAPRKVKPLNWGRIFFVLFMVLMALIVARFLRLKMIIFGLLYKLSS